MVPRASARHLGAYREQDGDNMAETIIQMLEKFSLCLGGVFHTMLAKRHITSADHVQNVVALADIRVLLFMLPWLLTWMKTTRA